MGDYFQEEYQLAKDGNSPFKARFIAWYEHKAYATPAPEGFAIPSYYEKLINDGLATPDQVYWHYQQTKGLTDKEELREYPTYDFEAFLLTGTGFFDADALLHHSKRIIKPMKEVAYAQALQAT